MPRDELDPPKMERIVLAGDAAIKLWREGKDAWNQWCKENTEADVSFEGVDFSTYREALPKMMVSFKGFNFPNGDVSFADARFGNGDVDFTDARFGDGDVDFTDARFGDGDVDFGDARFGDGDVDFADARFGNGNVSFVGARFGNGRVRFVGARFGNGNVSFTRASFGNGMVRFIGARFGDGRVYFDSASFGNGDVSFAGATFGAGNVYFDDARFGNGDVDFTDASFGDGIVSFNSATFGAGNYRFESIVFKGHLRLLDLNNCKKVKNISFKHSSFERSLDLSGNRFNCVVDLTNTSIANQVSLEGLSCELNRKKDLKFSHGIAKLPGKCLKKYLWFPLSRWVRKREWLTRTRAVDKDDIGRLRRLKEIAGDNKDHQRALDFHVQEIQAKRWIETTRFNDLLLECLFDTWSDYGRRESRVVGWMAGVWLLFSAIYAWASTNPELSWLENTGEAIVFSAGQMLPFIPSGRDARAEGIQSLFCGDLPSVIYLATYLQSLISVILIFLIVLALRNRFRI